MKNFLKTITTASFSLVAFGAMAQNVENTSLGTYNTAQRAIISQNDPAIQKLSNVGKVASAPNYLFLDYPFVDSVEASKKGVSYSASPKLLSGFFIQSMNAHYGPGDTGKNNTNNLLLVNCAVSFDTLINPNTLKGDYTTQGVEVDSLFIPVGQQNVSGVADSLLISINSVDANGIPTNTSLWSTLIIQDTGLSGKGKNWLHLRLLDFAPHVTVPGTGKFAVVMAYLASNKRDSMGFLYSYPEFTCSSPSEKLPDTTYVGHAISVTNKAGTHQMTVNSFTTGYEYFLPGHTGSPITLPELVAGDGGIGYGCSSPSVTSALPFQDITMFAEVSYTKALGVNNINGSGLSIGQNYPNPFNKQTTINYSLTKASDVTFTIYDITGRVVTATNYGNVAPGQYQVNINANTFTPGIYFYTFNVNGNTITKKMVITE